MKEKLMNYPTETEHEAMGQRQLTEDHGKLIFASGFFLAVIHSTFKDAPWKESTIKRSLDYLELFYDQRRKSARIIWAYCSLRNETKRNEMERNEMKICSLRNENL